MKRIVAAVLLFGCDFSYNDYRGTSKILDGSDAGNDVVGDLIEKDVSVETVQQDTGSDLVADSKSWHLDVQIFPIPQIPFSTEVTQEQYRLFVSSGKGKAPQCPDAGTDLSPDFGRQPVVCVSWEQASAYCQWTGASLCSKTEWINGCSSYGLHKGCMGSEQETLVACNTPVSAQLNNRYGIAPVKAYSQCKTPIGQYDMNGNVAEWTATCSVTGCLVQGGSHEASTGSCLESFSAPKQTTSPLVGFRCCSVTGD